MNSGPRHLPCSSAPPPTPPTPTPTQERHSLQLLTAQGRVAAAVLLPFFLFRHPFLTCNRWYQRWATYFHICHVRSVSIKGGKQAALTTGGGGALNEKRSQHVLAHN